MPCSCVVHSAWDKNRTKKKRNRVHPVPAGFPSHNQVSKCSWPARGLDWEEATRPCGCLPHSWIPQNRSPHPGPFTPPPTCNPCPELRTGSPSRSSIYFKSPSTSSTGVRYSRDTGDSPHPPPLSPGEPTSAFPTPQGTPNAPYLRRRT